MEIDAKGRGEVKSNLEDLDRDQSGALEIVTTYTSHSEDYVRRLPFWRFYELLATATKRMDKANAQSK